MFETCDSSALSPHRAVSAKQGGVETSGGRLNQWSPRHGATVAVVTPPSVRDSRVGIPIASARLRCNVTPDGSVRWTMLASAIRP